MSRTAIVAGLTDTQDTEGASVSELRNIPTAPTHPVAPAFSPLRRESVYGGFSLLYMRMPPITRDDAPCISASHSIDMAFIGPVESLTRRSGGPAEVRKVPHLSGSLHGGEEIAYIEAPEPSEFIEIVPGRHLRTTVAESLGIPGAADLAELQIGPDPVLMQTAARIRADALGGRRLDAVEAEEMVVLTLASLMERHLGGRPRPSHTGAPLDARRRARVFDLVEANLHRSLSLNELSDAAALSKYHFLRAFKATVGVTPGRYMQARRMEQARLLLLREGATTDVVASRVGYSSPSHFRDVFRQHFGTSPRRYLEEVTG